MTVAFDRGSFLLVTAPYISGRLHIRQAHSGIVVPLCSNRDLSTFLRQIANSTFDRSSFILHQTVERSTEKRITYQVLQMCKRPVCGPVLAGVAYFCGDIMLTSPTDVDASRSRYPCGPTPPPSTSLASFGRNGLSFTGPGCAETLEGSIAF